jgi:hypothetical protein
MTAPLARRRWLINVFLYGLVFRVPNSESRFTSHGLRFTGFGLRVPNPGFYESRFFYGFSIKRYYEFLTLAWLPVYAAVGAA